MFGFLKRKKDVQKSHDKYDELIEYTGISKREFMMTTEIEKMEKMKEKMEATTNAQIKKFSKMNTDELNSLYADIKETKNSFVNNVNMWSRTGLFAEKMDIVVHGYERLRDALREEIDKRKTSERKTQ